MRNIDGTKANDAAITPHEIMILAIHRRAPTLSKIKLDGTSNIKYPKKKVPTPNPNISPVRPNSLFMVSAANPTFTRSK